MGTKFGAVAYESLLAGERSGFVAYEKEKFYIEDFENAKKAKTPERDEYRLNLRLTI